MQAVSDEGMRSRIGWVTSEKIRKKLRKMLDIHNQLWYNAQAVSRGTTQQTPDEAERKNSEKKSEKSCEKCLTFKIRYDIMSKLSRRKALRKNVFRKAEKNSEKNPKKVAKNAWQENASYDIIAEHFPTEGAARTVVRSCRLKIE